jgi:hypothetical protein
MQPSNLREGQYLPRSEPCDGDSALRRESRMQEGRKEKSYAGGHKKEGSGGGEENSAG